MANVADGLTSKRFFRNYQVSMKLKLLFAGLATAVIHGQAAEAINVVTYPEIPGLVTSDTYTVSVAGKSIWTEKVVTVFDLKSLPEWFTGRPYVNQQQEVHITNFSCDGPVHVTIETPEPITNVAVRPLSRGIQTTIQGRSVEFVLPGPDNLYININDYPSLLFFANPPETEVPSPNDRGLRYFGPGTHHPGLMTLNSGDTIYLAPGAVVYGGIRADGADNIKVLGRGILDGGFQERLVHIWRSQNVTFEGVILRNGQGWTNTLENCEQVLYRNTKVISFGPTGDGINPLGCQHVRIEDSFFRCTDDCIAIKSPESDMIAEDIEVTNCTMVGFAYSDGITIGFETNGPRVSNIRVRNCDILQARGGSRVDGHSAFSIICDGPAVIENILYEDIRVEEDVLKLFELNITDGTQYDVNPPGHIANVRLKNISWSSVRPIILHGFSDDNRVTNVSFENCTVEGNPLSAVRNDIFSINEFVEDVRFESPAP
jgi:hypothetical protein